MPDDLKRTKPEDPTKINISQTWELEYWSKALGVSKAKLIEVVKKVGPMVSNVKRAL